MAAKPPVAIRITRPFQTEDELLAAELETISRTGVVLVGAQQRPDGVVLRFELALANGTPVIRGEGRVIGYKPNVIGSEPGLALRFTRLDSKSKALVDRAAALRNPQGPASSPRVPEPAPSGDIPVEVAPPAPTSSAENVNEASAPEPPPQAVEPPPPPPPPPPSPVEDRPPIAQARDRSTEGVLARLRERAAAISPEVREQIFADGASRRRH